MVSATYLPPVKPWPMLANCLFLYSTVTRKSSSTSVRSAIPRHADLWPVLGFIHQRRRIAGHELLCCDSSKNCTRSWERRWLTQRSAGSASSVSSLQATNHPPPGRSLAIDGSGRRQLRPHSTLTRIRSRPGVLAPGKRPSWVTWCQQEIQHTKWICPSQLATLLAR